MKPKSAIAKGKELEKWIISRLKASRLDNRAHRTPGSGSGLQKGDVANDLNLAIEAKNTKTFSSSYWKQAKEQTKLSQRTVLVWHPPQKPMDDSLVMIDWYFFEELLKHWRKETHSEIQEPDRETKWLLENMVKTAKKLIKKLET